MKSTLIAVLDKVYLACIWTAGAAIFAMSLIVPWGVFARYVLGKGAQWPEPLAILLMIVFTFIGAAATYRAGGDIAVSALTARLPQVPRRVLARVVDLTMALMCAFVLWYGTQLCVKTMAQTIAELPWLPVGVTYLPIPIGAFITLLFVLERLAFGSQTQRAVVTLGERRAAPLSQEAAN